MNKLVVIFLLAFLLRVCLVFVAYHGDLNNNISWATLAVERKLVNFYEAEEWSYSAPNQPPLTILMFAGLRLIWQMIENASWWLNKSVGLFPSSFIWFWEAKGMILLVKLPAILADLGIAWLIYKYFRNKELAKKLSIIWLLNPVSWYNSAIWGQTDAVVNFLGLAAILLLLKKKLIPSSIFLVLSLLFKASLVIFIPIWLFVALWQKHKVFDWLKAWIGSLTAIVLTGFWFHPKIDLFVWLINLYQKRVLPGEMGFLTANAFNFWWLIDSGKTLDSTIFFGLPARIWSFMFIIIALIGLTVFLKKRLSNRRILFSLTLIVLVSFLFMTRMHERYLYPFFPLATILLSLMPATTVIPYLVLSTTHLLNLYHLFWAPPLAIIEALYLKPEFSQILALVNLGVFIYLLRQLQTSKI